MNYRNSNNFWWFSSVVVDAKIKHMKPYDSNGQTPPLTSLFHFPIRSKRRLERSSATPISDPSKFHLFVSLQTTEPPKNFRRFPRFGRFQAKRTSSAVGNLAVSASNAPFSPRNSVSWRLFGRKCIFDPTFGLFPPTLVVIF